MFCTSRAFQAGLSVSCFRFAQFVARLAQAVRAAGMFCSSGVSVLLRGLLHTGSALPKDEFEIGSGRA